MLNKFKLKSKIILIGIILIAAILRIWKLDVVPPSLTPDEASLGYNAYSILKTGRDEYGKILPIIFKSFGDYKPGLYIYTTVPIVALIGLNEWSVRLPSALAGVLAVWLMYLVVKYFTKEDKSNGNIALFASFLLAISPWHIQFSRGAWEVNLALTLTLTGIYFFLKSLTNIKFLKYSAIFFSLTFITYQGAKLSTTIVIFTLAVAFWREILGLLKTKPKAFLIPALSGIIITLPILMSFASGQTGRLTVFSVFSYPRPESYLQKFLDEGGEKVGTVGYYLNHSETLNFTRGVMGRWFNHYSGRFLFFEGDWPNPRHTPPNHGVLMLFDILLIPLGLFYMVRRGNQKLILFSLLWLVLAPLPAALSRDSVQAVRAYNLLVPMILLSSYGIYHLTKDLFKLKYLWVKLGVNALLIFIFTGSIVYYLDAYFVHVPTHNARYWEYGMKQVVEIVTKDQDKYKNIIVQQSYAQPYIYFLFYGQKINPVRFDPKKYQENAKLTNYLGPDVGLVEKLDNITFSFFSWPVPLENNMLVVGTPIVITDYNKDDYNLVSEIKYPNGDVIYKILESKPYYENK